MNKLKYKEESSSAAQGSGGPEADPEPWDPLGSADWDRETHTKGALMRIKRSFLSYYLVDINGINFRNI